jgi:hypothetical protein
LHDLDRPVDELLEFHRAALNEDSRSVRCKGRLVGESAHA